MSGLSVPNRTEVWRKVARHLMMTRNPETSILSGVSVPNVFEVGGRPDFEYLCCTTREPKKSNLEIPQELEQH